MPRRFAAVLALAAALPPGAAAPVPVHLFLKEQPYFPARVGAEWVYDDDGRELRFAVTKVEEKDGVTLVTVGVYQSDGKTTQHFRTIEVSKTGLRETHSGDRVIDPPTPVLKVPSDQGDKWESPFSLDGTRRGDCVLTAEGVEEVKVPAGTFRALRVVNAFTDLDGKPVCRTTTWYAPGVGPVRIKYSANGTRDLVSFTPGKGGPAGN